MGWLFLQLLPLVSNKHPISLSPVTGARYKFSIFCYGTLVFAAPNGNVTGGRCGPTTDLRRTESTGAKHIQTRTAAEAARNQVIVVRKLRRR